MHTHPAAPSARMPADICAVGYPDPAAPQTRFVKSSSCLGRNARILPVFERRAALWGVDARRALYLEPTLLPLRTMRRKRQDHASAFPHRRGRRLRARSGRAARSVSETGSGCSSEPFSNEPNDSSHKNSPSMTGITQKRFPKGQLARMKPDVRNQQLLPSRWVRRPPSR